MRARRARGAHDHAGRLLRPHAPGEPGGEPRTFRLQLREGAVEPRATVGSGDAFLAGFVASRYNARSVPESLTYAVACGAESTEHLGAGLVDPERINRLVPEVELSRPELPAEVG